MPRKKKDETKASQVVQLEGDIYIAVHKYHHSFLCQRSYSKTINDIIRQWIEKTPPALRGYEKP